VGSAVTLAQLRRGLTLSRDTTEALCNALVESGHFEQGREVRAGNKRLTVEYKIVSLDPEPTERARPVLLEVGPEPEYSEQAPEPDTYLGEDDFEGYEP
jgi:hypothetical protein